MTAVLLCPPGAAQIELTQGLVAFVDPADVAMLERYIWSAHKTDHLWYARTHLYQEGTRDVRAMMHNFLTGWPQVDHVNGNGLDNRRCNLRPATRQQNMGNRRKGSGSSRYKGAYWQKSVRRWRAQIGVDGKRVYLGLFDSEEAAARAYDDAARAAFGDFAALNFPRPGEASCHR